MINLQVFNVDSVAVSLPPGDRVDLPVSMLSFSDLDTAAETSPQRLDAKESAQTEQIEGGPVLFQLSRSTTNHSGNEQGPKCYAGVRQYTAPEGCIILSPELWERLQIAKQYHISLTLTPVRLPRGSFAVLECLSGRKVLQSVPDLRSTLESHLRRNQYVTLSVGQILTIKQQTDDSLSDLQFLVKQLRSSDSTRDLDAVHLVDTDIAVDIQFATADGATISTEISVTSPFNTASTKTTTDDEIKDLTVGQELMDQSLSIRNGSTYYHIELPKTASAIRIKLESVGTVADLVLFASTLTKRPSRMDCQYISIHGPDVKQNSGCRYLTIKISEATILHPDNSILPAGHLYLTVSTYSTLLQTVRFNIMADLCTEEDEESSVSELSTVINNKPDQNSEKCLNCESWVPSRSIAMHSAFCARNNWLCPRCRQIIPKMDRDLHWHCPQCNFFGDSSEQAKHVDFYHTLITCSCSLPLLQQDLMHHRTVECPERPILCRYCHSILPAGPQSNIAKDRLLPGTPLTQHESECGSRTIECQKCRKMVPIKDVRVHMELLHRLAPTPDGKLICANQVCGRWMDSRNDMRLCARCFGPFYDQRLDETGERRMQRLINRYFLQLKSGCGHSRCFNPYCASSSRESNRVDRSADATQIALDSLEMTRDSVKNNNHWFCVDDTAGKMRWLAETRLAPLGYNMEWCLEALEKTKRTLASEQAENSDSEEIEDKVSDIDEKWAQQSANWLIRNAPTTESC